MEVKAVAVPRTVNGMRLWTFQSREERYGKLDVNSASEIFENYVMLRLLFTASKALTGFCLT